MISIKQIKFLKNLVKNGKCELTIKNCLECRLFDYGDTRITAFKCTAIEVWDAIADWKLDYFLGCAIKYITRAGRKDSNKEIEDLKKAVNYLNKKISLIESENEKSI